MTIEKRFRMTLGIMLMNLEMMFDDFGDDVG